VANDPRSLSEELSAKGISDERVLAAIAVVRRHLFVPEHYADSAYEDQPLPIGYGQTISQPYVVALMTEALELEGRERVLEIGTGSGYQTAILARLCAKVFSIEVLRPLYERARETLLERLELSNVSLRLGDGAAGWPEEGPFDAIVLTAAPKEVPEILREQLRPGGRMVLPLGSCADDQKLVLITRGKNGLDETEDLIPVRFVPMVDSGGHQV
jgi:protein-L-isoaspartate(D-aspartate) O-methyltransferase